MEQARLKNHCKRLFQAVSRMAILGEGCLLLGYLMVAGQLLITSWALYLANMTLTWECGPHFAQPIITTIIIITITIVVITNVIIIIINAIIIIISIVVIIIILIIDFFILIRGFGTTSRVLVARCHIGAIWTSA